MWPAAGAPPSRPSWVAGVRLAALALLLALLWLLAGCAGPRAGSPSADGATGRPAGADAAAGEADAAADQADTAAGQASGAAAEEADLSAPGPGRLPRVAVPERYELDFDIDPREERFTGRGTIHLVVRAPTDRLWLHMVDLEPWRLEVQAGGRTLKPEVRPAEDEVAAEDGAVQLVLPETLPPGPVRIVAAWDAPFAAGLRGLYRAQQDAAWFAYTQFQVGDARRAFPSLDEPDLKARFAIRVTHPREMLAFSNAPEASSRTGRETRTTIFEETPPLPTYLVALTVGRHDVVRSEQDPRIRILVPAGQASRARVALRLHEVLLAELEDWFGIPFPFEKLDAVSAVEFAAGAMENAGLMLYREERLLVDPATTPPEQFRDAVDTIAHEIAHQWFGDLVTPAWWDDIWLNEAFATWVSRKIVDEWRPSLGLGLGALMGRDRVMAWDSLSNARPIRGPVASLADAGRAFGLVYGKGQSLLDMLEAWVGPEDFQAGVRDYLETHAWGNATAEDLFAALERVSGKAVAPVALSFLDQAGVPAVELSLTCDADGARVALAQRPWRPDEDVAGDGAGGSDAPQLWDLPVCLAWPTAADAEGAGLAGAEGADTAGGEGAGTAADAEGPAAAGMSGGAPVASRCVRLDEPSASVELTGGGCPAWVHPNAGEYGYYRWSVPDAMLPRLAEATAASWDLEDRPDAARRSRVALLDQTWGMVAVGGASPAAYASLAERLAPAEDPLVLTEVVDAVDQLTDVWPWLEQDPRFSAWVRRVLGPAWARIGPEPAAEEGPAVRELRGRLMVLLGEAGRDEAVRERAVTLATRWLEDPGSVPGELAGPALWVAARTGAVGFQALRGALADASRSEERLAALTGLSRLPPAEGLDEALGLLLEDGAVRRQDGRYLLMPALSDPESRAAALRFLTDHFEALGRRLAGWGSHSPDRWGWMVGSFCDPESRDRARDFLVEQGANPERGPLALGLEQAGRCIALQEAGDEEMRAWLAGL